MINPGSTIGMLGGGQLGRMSLLAGRAMGYRFGVYEPMKGCTAGMVADFQFNSSYEDESALMAFADRCDVVTLEFENVPEGALRCLEERVEVHPSSEVLYVTRNRIREKAFLKEHGFPVGRYVPVYSGADLAEALKSDYAGGVLKTAEMGYDGKGQAVIPDMGGVNAADLWSQLDIEEGVFEEFIDFEAECSVICVRNTRGEVSVYPVAENIHRNQILHASIVPGRLDGATIADAKELAGSIAEALGIVGVLGVEMFVLKNGDVLVNELAPRPHNSGHYTMDACVTSQFEQHIRAVCGLGLGSTELLKPVVMVNLLGHLWGAGEPDWGCVLEDSGMKLHLYDKGQAKMGRKMGHINVVGDDAPGRAQSVMEVFEGQALRQLQT